MNIRRVDVKIQYQATLGATSESDKFDGDGTIPLPTFAIGGRWKLSDKWQSIFRYELFFLSFENVAGSQQDFQLLLEQNTFKHVGFGIGFNTVDQNVRARDDDFRGEFDSRILGLLGYSKIYF